MSTIVYVKFRCAALHIKKALGIFRDNTDNPNNKNNYTVSQKNDTDVTHYRFNPHQPSCGWLRACGKARGRHFEQLQLTGSVHSHPHSPGEDTCLWRTEKTLFTDSCFPR